MLMPRSCQSGEAIIIMRRQDKRHNLYTTPNIIRVVPTKEEMDETRSTMEERLEIHKKV